jgi:hypothetical protein
MYLEKAIRELRKEREQLERIIKSLEAINEEPQPPPAKRRGRKSMNPEQRQEVSQRMRKYWEEHRQKKAEEGEG